MRLASRELLLAGDITGHRPLREAMSAHLGLTRGVVCDPDQIFILSGIQQALDLVARLTLDPGDEAWVEDPGYPGATTMFQAVGANPIPVPVDESGLRVTEGIRISPRARLAYVTPAHQFPLCVTMSVERRVQLIEWSRQTGAWIFEDDCDSEFRFDGRPLPALQGLHPKGNVIFAGSFSKMLFPSLRIGYLVVPPHLVEAMRAARSITDRYGPSLTQAVLSDFIAEGHFDRHLRRMRGIYGEHLEALARASECHWGERLVVRKTQTGLQTVALLRDGGSAEELARAAKDVGVEVVPVSRYAIRSKPDDKLQLGFAAVSPSELRVGVEAVSRLLDSASLAGMFAKPRNSSDKC
jgi:GntR family transcriptional regulator/MocR family aminotransferase